MPLLVKNAIYWIGFEYSNLPIYEDALFGILMILEHIEGQI